MKVPLKLLAGLLRATADGVVDRWGTPDAAALTIVSKAALNFAAELAERGIDPQVAIQELREIVADVDRVNAEVEQAIRSKFRS